MHHILKGAGVSRLSPAKFQKQVRIVVALFAAMAVSALTAPSNIGEQGDRTAGARVHDSAQASTRLMKELMETYKCDSYKKGVFSVELVNDNLYEWEVKLLFPDPEQALHGDMDQLRKLGKRDYVLVRITFSQNYPNEMPFVRTVYPYMLGRHSGAFCMYLLSPKGWIPGCTVEALVLTIIDHMQYFRYRVDFNPKESEYSDENSETDRWWFSQMHDWNKPRPKDHPWYAGPTFENN